MKEYVVHGPCLKRPTDLRATSCRALYWYSRGKQFTPVLIWIPEWPDVRETPSVCQKSFISVKSSPEVASFHCARISYQKQPPPRASSGEGLIIGANSQPVSSRVRLLSHSRQPRLLARRYILIVPLCTPPASDCLLGPTAAVSMLW